MYICVYIYIYICIYVYIYIYIHMYTYIHILPGTPARRPARSLAWSAGLLACPSRWLARSISIYYDIIWVYMYICMCVCMYIYIYIHTFDI